MKIETYLELVNYSFCLFFSEMSSFNSSHEILYWDGLVFRRLWKIQTHESYRTVTVNFNWLTSWLEITHIYSKSPLMSPYWKEKCLHHFINRDQVLGRWSLAVHHFRTLPTKLFALIGCFCITVSASGRGCWGSRFACGWFSSWRITNERGPWRDVLFVSFLGPLCSGFPLLAPPIEAVAAITLMSLRKLGKWAGSSWRICVSHGLVQLASLPNTLDYN